jgi:hypothetical protein
MASSTLSGAARASTKRNQHGQANKPRGTSKAIARRLLSARAASPDRLSHDNPISRGHSPMVTNRPSDQRSARSLKNTHDKPPIVGYTDTLWYLLML